MITEICPGCNKPIEDCTKQFGLCIKNKCSTNCHDCGAKPGELHKEGCDSPRCTICGIQLFMCEHYPEGNSVHSGVESQEVKVIAETLNLYCKYEPAIGLISCSEHADGASYDLNRAGEIYQLALQKVRLKESE